LQELNADQIGEAIVSAAERKVPIVITSRIGKCWTNLRSRMLAFCEGHLIIDVPSATAESASIEIPVFSPGDKINISFKLKHYKHIFTTTVVGSKEIAQEGGPVAVLSLCKPMKMQRLQRRSYERVEIPLNRIVRASVWMGGVESEPSQASSDLPVWSGPVTNLSVGGVQIICDASASICLDAGDAVGIRLNFGLGEQSVYVNGQFRHCEPDGNNVRLGFQFVGLDQGEDGKKSLDTINAKVREFSRANQFQHRFPSRVQQPAIMQTAEEKTSQKSEAQD